MASDNATGAPTAKEGDNNKVTGAPSARGGDKHNLHATCCGLYKFGGPGVVHDPVANERALRAWDDAANSALARRLKQQILDLGHYSRMVERIPRRTHELTHDGVLITTPAPCSGRRYHVVVPRPGPNEPATTVADCGPEDLPSP